MILGRLIDQEPEELGANLRQSATNTIRLAHIIALEGRDVSKIVEELESNIQLTHIAVEWGGAAMEELFGQIMMSIHQCGQALES